jgi:hypothetical protein
MLTWSVVHRTQRGDAQWDRRLWARTIRFGEGEPEPSEILPALYLALRDAYSLNGLPWPEAAREPRGALGGGQKALREAMEYASGVSMGGHAIDTDTE